MIARRWNAVNGSKDETISWTNEGEVGLDLASVSALKLSRCDGHDGLFVESWNAGV